MNLHGLKSVQPPPPNVQSPVLLCGDDAKVADWIWGHIPDEEQKENSCYTAIGVAPNGFLIAGVVYCNYMPQFETIQLHIATDNLSCLDGETSRELLTYPFDEIGVYKCLIMIPSDNKKILQVIDSMKFKREATLKHHFGENRHGIIFSMLKPDFQNLYGEDHDQSKNQK